MIYKVSFKSPIKDNDEEYDNVDFSYLNKIILKKKTIKELDNSIEYDVSFRLYSEQISDEIENLYLAGLNTKLKDSEIKVQIENQIFVDQIAQAFYDKKIPDHCECITKAKEEIIKEFGKILFDKGALCINSTYDCFGFLYTNNEKIGTFDGIKITKKNEVQILDYQSIVDIKNAINLTSEMYIENKSTFSFNVQNVVDDNLVINSLNLENNNVPEEIKSLKRKEDFASYDDFILSRREMILSSSTDDIDIDIDIID